MFSVDAISAAGPLTDLIRSPHEKWEKQILIPFPTTWVEISGPLGSYGAMIKDGLSYSFHAETEEHTVVMMPFALDFNNTDLEGWPLLKAGCGHPPTPEFLDLVWNTHETKGWPHPDIKTHVIGKDTSLMNGSTISHEQIMGHIPGLARLLCAALAFINTPRAVEFVDQPGKTSTFIGGEIRPYPKRQLIVIRPDGVRTVKRAAQQRNTPPTPKREHDVRSHLRHYKSGKVAVVRSHRRGDADLGTVRSEYIVEKDPNKDLQ